MGGNEGEVKNKEMTLPAINYIVYFRSGLVTDRGIHTHTWGKARIKNSLILSGIYVKGKYIIKTLLKFITYKKQVLSHLWLKKTRCLLAI